jgi:hypothetical protein
MESKAARITRYVVLAVFLCLTLGAAGLALYLAALDFRTSPWSAGRTAPLLAALKCLLCAGIAWRVFHACSGWEVGAGALLLGLFSVFSLGIASLGAGLSDGELAASAWTPARSMMLFLALIWALAITGTVLATRERRRLLSLASAAG